MHISELLRLPEPSFLASSYTLQYEEYWKAPLPRLEILVGFVIIKEGAVGWQNWVSVVLLVIHVTNVIGPTSHPPEARQRRHHLLACCMLHF